MNVQEELFRLQDKKYASFQENLTPGIRADDIIGVRVPALRGLAVELEKAGEADAFLANLPHQYYDENMLHAAILCRKKPFDACMEAVEAFLPYVDNWAVCDTTRPKIFAKNKEQLMKRIPVWIASKETYTCRFGMGMLMAHFLDGDFREEYLELPASVCSEEYYVNMMIAWFYATALAKQWDATIPYLEKKRLSKWTHNKTIQKARESFRITPEQKEYLKTLKQF